jgi:hypothetical protein
MAEYNAEREAGCVKTERISALRLAKEAEVKSSAGLRRLTRQRRKLLQQSGSS